MDGLDADMDIEQIEKKIARMKRNIEKKQKKLQKWEQTAMIMKKVPRSVVVSKSSVTADVGAESAGVEEHNVDPASAGVPIDDLVMDLDQDGPLTQAENPPCKPPGGIIEHSGNDPSDGKSKTMSTPDTPQQDSSQTSENAAIMAVRRSSRRSRSSYILNSDEFITLDIRQITRKKKLDSQVSPESESSLPGSGSEQAVQRLVFPAPPKIVAEQPIIDFCLPEDEFAAWKIRFRRKTSLRSGTRASSDPGTDEHPKVEEAPVLNDNTMKENNIELVEVPLLSNFKPVFSLDTLVPESIELVHCGRVVIDDDSVRAIAAVQSSKISVWAEKNNNWTLLLKVPLLLQHDVFYKFSGFNSPNSMGLALVTDTGRERTVWCYDLTPPGRERRLEYITLLKSGQSSYEILTCVVEETLIFAQVGSKGTQLKTYHLDVLKGKQLRNLTNVKDMLISLQPIMQLKDAVIGFSPTVLYVWNHRTGELCKQMQLPGNLPFHKCTFAQDESGLLMLGVVTGASNPKHHLVVANPAMHKSRVLREYQDVVELPNQCFQDTARIGQHLVARGGDEVGRVAIWNFFSGKLAAFLNDSTVTAVCTFPAECSEDFLVSTGTQQGIVILYKLPFPQV